MTPREPEALTNAEQVARAARRPMSDDDTQSSRRRSPRMKAQNVEVLADVITPDLTAAQFAALKGVSTRTVRNWIALGYLKANRVGPRLVRIPAAELHRIDTPMTNPW